MKIIQSIRVKKQNLEALEELDCIAELSYDAKGEKMAVILKQGHTRGSLIVHEGDWLVQYASGEWQRYGNEAYISMVQNGRPQQRTTKA